MIAEIPESIAQFDNLGNLFVHNNPIVALPLGFQKVWDNIQEFSIDWFSYLFPFVGKMITRAQFSECEDTDQESAPEQKIKMLNKNKS